MTKEHLPKVTVIVSLSQNSICVVGITLSRLKLTRYILQRKGIYASFEENASLTSLSSGKKLRKNADSATIIMKFYSFSLGISVFMCVRMRYGPVLVFVPGGLSFGYPR